MGEKSREASVQLIPGVTNHASVQLEPGQGPVPHHALLSVTTVSDDSALMGTTPLELRVLRVFANARPDSGKYKHRSEGDLTSHLINA